MMTDFFDSHNAEEPERTAAHGQKKVRNPGMTPELFRHRLQKLCSKPLSIRFNENHSTLLSVRPQAGGSEISVSLHKMFLLADEKVLMALAQYVKKTTPDSRSAIRQFINEHSQDYRADDDKPLRQPLRSRGAVYDLHRLAGEVNAEYFNNSLQVAITWSRGAVEPAGRSRRHIIFGSYDARHKLIRIHPALDHAAVPEFFLKFVIYHEMLHAVLDPRPQPGGRRCVHTPQFRERERRHPDYLRAMKWETEFMAKGGKLPMPKS
jgi:hypothetical protein